MACDPSQKEKFLEDELALVSGMPSCEDVGNECHTAMKAVEPPGFEAVHKEACGVAIHIEKID